VLPKAFFTAVAVLGLGCALAGLALLTVLAPAGEVGGEVPVDGLLVTDPGVAALTGGMLTVEVRGAGPVFAGAARRVDAEAWVGDAPAARVVGLTGDALPDVRPGAGTEAVPPPRESDVWTDLAEGDGSVTLALTSPSPDTAVVVVAETATVRLGWQRDAGHPVAWPLVLGGTLLVLWGVPGLVRRNRHDRRRRAARSRARRAAPGPRGRVVARGTRGTWALAGAVALAGCATVPVPDPAVSTGSAVAVTPAQMARVLTDVGAAVAAGNAERRLTGPALAWHVSSADGASGPAPRSTADLAAAVSAAGPGVRGWPLLAPRTAQWPRSFAVEVPAAAMVAVLVAAGPREPYRLWAALPRLAERPLPPWPTATDGAVLVADGSAALADVTADLPTRFADVLARGDASEHAPEFAADPVSAAVRDRVTALVGAASSGATVEHVAAPAPGAPPVLALVDADGGAVVAAAVTTTVTVTASPGNEAIRLPDDVAGVAGAPAARRVQVVSTVALVFAVPEERGNIGPLAAADGITSVTAS
jgi:hypothetical protein